MSPDLEDLGVRLTSESGTCLLCVMSKDIEEVPGRLINGLAFIWHQGATGADLLCCSKHVEYLEERVASIERQTRKLVASMGQNN